MIKRIVLLLLCACLTFTLCSCSSETDESSDEDNPFSVFGDNIFPRYAIVYFPDGTTVSGKLDYWSFSSSTTIMHVTIEGTKYITDSKNIYLSSEVFE